MAIEERYHKPIRMEEEEETDEDEPRVRRPFGFSSGSLAPVEVHEREKPERPTPQESMREVFLRLTQERETILQNDKLTTKEKLTLLETNRKTMVIARGGAIRKTENVVYSILVFSTVVIVILSLLTAFSGLPKEVTLTFVGTVVGGTISIIAQKLGKV
jgi:hypothetical protein